MTTALPIILGFLLGAIVGSFLAALCLRWPAGRSVVRGRSQCDGCGTVLRARELLPLVSGPFTQGRARCCGVRIDPLHGQVEWAAALVGGAAVLAGGPLQGGALALFGWLLLPLAILDARHFWLPDRLTLLLAGSGLLLGGLLTDNLLITRLLTGVGAAVALAAIGIAFRLIRKREGLGDGDPKLLGAIGLWLGPELTLATLLAAALLGLAEAALSRRGMDEARPFGTLLAIGAWLVAAASMARP